MRYQSTKPDYHRLYRLAIWVNKPHGLRWQCLTKALYKCRQCGWQARLSDTHLLVADHIIPHKGDWNLFVDTANHKCLCKPCHDGAKQSQERLGYAIGCDATGKPNAHDHPWNRKAPGGGG